MNRRANSIATELFLTALLIFGAEAWAVPGDYDGDGRADLAIIDADQEEDKTTVFVKLSSNGSEEAFVFFPFGDFVISGDFFGNGRTYPGIVSIPTYETGLEWHIKKPSGGEQVFRFGVKGDQVPNQGDLDCDGKTDYVVVHPGREGRRIWRAKLSTKTRVQRTVFGGRNDLVFTADVDGNGCSEIVALTPEFRWWSRSFTGETITKLKWGRRGDIPLLPTDLDGDGIPEYITVRNREGRLVALIHAVTEVNTRKRLGAVGSMPMTGNFFGSTGFGWFIPAGSKFVLVTPQKTLAEIYFGNPRRGIVRPDGTAVPEGEDGSFGG